MFQVLPTPADADINAAINELFGMCLISRERLVKEADSFQNAAKLSIF